MERLVMRVGTLPAVPTQFDMGFILNVDKTTFDGLQKIFNQLCDLTDILGDDYSIDRLRELVKADQNERCVVLPCKVGDVIHKLEFSEEHGLFFISDKVTSVTTSKNGWVVRTKSKFYPIKQSDGYDFAPLSQCPNALADFYVGTMEEAEAALEKMKAERK